MFLLRASAGISIVVTLKMTGYSLVWSPMRARARAFKNKAEGTICAARALLSSSSAYVRSLCIPNVSGGFSPSMFAWHSSRFVLRIYAAQHQHRRELGARFEQKQKSSSTLFTRAPFACSNCLHDLSFRSCLKERKGARDLKTTNNKVKDISDFTVRGYRTVTGVKIR